MKMCLWCPSFSLLQVIQGSKQKMKEEYKNIVESIVFG